MGKRPSATAGQPVGGQFNLNKGQSQTIVRLSQPALISITQMFGSILVHCDQEPPLEVHSNNSTLVTGATVRVEAATDKVTGFFAVVSLPPPPKQS